MPARTGAVSAEGLDENRAGHLTGDQTRRFDRMVSDRRRGVRGLVLPVGAIGALLLAVSGPAATTVTRHLAGWGCLAAAAAILVAPAFDPLAADLRAGRVETAQGAIGKRRVQSMTSTGRTRYYVDIAGRALQTSFAAYVAAPDAGYVRAYYLPRTRQLVSLERLPNPPLPSGPDEVRAMFGQIARAFVSRDAAVLAEARARAAGLTDAVRPSNVEPSREPVTGRQGALTHGALVGTWTHPLVSVTLADDGTATMTTMAGARRSGHWSVDGQGRLLTDAGGTLEPMEAALDGDRLTIRLDGRRLTFDRTRGV